MTFWWKELLLAWSRTVKQRQRHEIRYENYNFWNCQHLHFSSFCWRCILSGYHTQLRRCCFCLFMCEWLSLGVLLASWVAAAAANDAPAVFNPWHLFVCFVNEYAKLERLISFSLSVLQGAVHVAQTVVVGRAAPSDQHPDSRPFTSLSYLELWEQRSTEPRFNSGLNQQSELPKAETLNEPLGWSEVATI